MVPRLGSLAMGGVRPCSKAGISTAPEVLLMTLCMTTWVDDVNCGFKQRRISLTFVLGQVQRFDSVENLRVAAATSNNW